MSNVYVDFDTAVAMEEVALNSSSEAVKCIRFLRKAHSKSEYEMLCAIAGADPDHILLKFKEMVIGFYGRQWQVDPYKQDVTAEELLKCKLRSESREATMKSVLVTMAYFIRYA